MKILFLCFILISCSILYAQQGELYELQEIKFEGNNSISSSTLKKIIYSEETPWWFYKFLYSFTPLGAGPVYFDSSYISIDLESLREYYTANGFFKSHFDYSYDVDTTDKEVTLIYKINEGDPAYYGTVNVTGLDSLEKRYHNELLSMLKIDTSDVYQQAVVQNYTSSINVSFMDNGYMLGKFDSVVVVKDTSLNKANMDFFFTPGIQYHVDSVFVAKTGDGADLISDELIIDISGIETGEWFDYDKFRQKQTSMSRTGLFSSLSISPVISDTSGNKVPLRIDANISKLHELSPEIIMNNQQSAFNLGLAASYSKKNFLGNARKLTFQASFGLQDVFNLDYGRIIKNFSFRDTTFRGYIESRATITQPDVFDEPIFGTWDNYLRIQKLKTINTTIYGSKITFEFTLHEYNWINLFNLYYNIEQVNEVYKTRNDSLHRQLLSVIGTDIGRTTSDNLLFPTQGYNLTFQIEEANSLPYLIGKIIGQGFKGSLFYKLVMNSSYYYALTEERNMIAAAKLKLGHLKPYVGNFDEIPNNRTFYTGGSNSIRGWRPNQLPGIENKGGGFLIEGSLEMRYKFIQEFGAAVFFDYGNTWRKYTSMRLDEFALAPGFGFRYYSSVAPFRVDFGFKLYDPETQRTIFHRSFWSAMEFHFGIGEAF